LTGALNKVKNWIQKKGNDDIKDWMQNTVEKEIIMPAIDK
jgi:hypothetical protein